MSSIQWTAIKDAIAAWFIAGSGLAAKRVLFRGQNMARPSGEDAFIAMRIRDINPRALGAPVIRKSAISNPAPGADEVLVKVQNHARVVLEATCYPARPADGSQPADASEAYAILSDVITATDLPSRKRALSAAGMGMLTFEPVLALDGVINSSTFEARAIFTCAFMVPSELTDTMPSIETVNAELAIYETDTADIVGNFPVSVDLTS